MKMLLESKANPMPHITYNLKTGKKVVQKILEIVNEVIDLTSSIVGHERPRHFPYLVLAFRYSI
jgi:hypothetical protein